MQPEGIADPVSTAIDGLGISELQSALRQTSDVHTLLGGLATDSENQQLQDAQRALASALESGRRALRFENTGKTKLGIYLLHLEHGTSLRPATAGRELVVSQRLTGGGIPDNLKVRVVHTEALPPLLDESRNIVWVDVEGRLVPLLESGDDREYKGYADNWKRFHEAGMPVPPLYLRGLNGRLMIPEIKQDGSEVYGTGLARDLYQRRRRERPRPQVDPLFLGITSEDNFPDLQEMAIKFMMLANESNLQLPFRDPFQLIVHTDGSWELTMRDLRGAKDIAQYPHLYEPGELQARNEQCVALWLLRLKVLRQFISGEPSQLTASQLRLLFNPEPVR